MSDGNAALPQAEIPSWRLPPLRSKTPRAKPSPKRWRAPICGAQWRTLLADERVRMRRQSSDHLDYPRDRQKVETGKFGNTKSEAGCSQTVNVAVPSSTRSEYTATGSNAQCLPVAHRIGNPAVDGLLPPHRAMNAVLHSAGESAFAHLAIERRGESTVRARTVLSPMIRSGLFTGSISSNHDVAGAPGQKNWVPYPPGQ